MIPKLAIDLIKQFEGLRLKAYLDIVGVKTIGYGHTGNDFPDIITLEQAENFLIKDLNKHLIGVYKNCPKLINESENKVTALLDFTFNLGIGRLAASTLRRKVNEKDWLAASIEIQKWCFAGGKKIRGLQIRRAVESKLLLK